MSTRTEVEFLEEENAELRKQVTDYRNALGAMQAERDQMRDLIAKVHAHLRDAPISHIARREALKLINAADYAGGPDAVPRV